MKTKKLSESAIMLALATILSIYKPFSLPYGGSVTIASMAPIIYIAIKYGLSWGMLTSITYSLLQMALGFVAPPTKDFISFALVILLDYVVAFGVLGLAGVFAKMFKNKLLGVEISTAIVLALRFLCHFLSGIIIWKSYAPEGQSPALYSLLYNGSYMVCELVITMAAMFFLATFLLKNADSE